MLKEFLFGTEQELASKDYLKKHPTQPFLTSREVWLRRKHEIRSGRLQARQRFSISVAVATLGVVYMGFFSYKTAS